MKHLDPLNAADQLTQLDLPAKITPKSTRRERQFAHKAKMEGKRFDRERHGQEDTLYAAFLRYRSGSIAQVNRHTGKPHEHAREMMRREMSPIRRRAFVEALRQGLDATAARKVAADQMAAF